MSHGLHVEHLRTLNTPSSSPPRPPYGAFSYCVCLCVCSSTTQGNSYTSKCLKISSSTAQVRDQCMDIVSNSRIQEAEYTRWKMGRKDAKATTLTVSECNARRARMNKIVQGHKVSCSGVLP